MALPRIAITSGEPAGVGPELIVQLSQQFSRLNIEAELIVIGDAALIEDRAQAIGQSIQLTPFADEKFQASSDGCLSVIHVPLIAPAPAQQLRVENAQYVINILQTAAQGAISGRFDAICTAPVHKGIINDAGIPFSGHTEFFADCANIDKVVMLLQAPLTVKNMQRTFRTALVTTHLPLRDVANAITADNVQHSIEILHQHLTEQCAIKQPKILVAGLNPHAGEGGHLGMEEIEIINPVIESLQNRGWDISSCMPADTMFTPPYLAQADAFLGMYHDQALPVLKHAGFHHAANITLGLPFIRTSVDHGTALNLAGTGKADCNSLCSALFYAVDLASKKHAS